MRLLLSVILVFLNVTTQATSTIKTAKSSLEDDGFDMNTLYNNIYGDVEPSNNNGPPGNYWWNDNSGDNLITTNDTIVYLNSFVQSLSGDETKNIKSKF